MFAHFGIHGMEIIQDISLKGGAGCQLLYFFLRGKVQNGEFVALF
jgi:hypothetical protein